MNLFPAEEMVVAITVCDIWLLESHYDCLHVQDVIIDNSARRVTRAYLCAHLHLDSRACKMQDFVHRTGASRRLNRSVSRLPKHNVQ